MLQLTDKVGQGKERACYVHPDDSSKAVKVLLGDESTQMQREIRIYEYLNKNKAVPYKRIPAYYGTVETNLGTGYVFDLVRDADGQVSKSLKWYLQHGSSPKDFKRQLKNLRRYFLKYKVIFNHDMYEGNILVRITKKGRRKLVVIDGLGEVTFVQWPNRFGFFAKRKIMRRWQRFYRRLLRNYDSFVQRSDNAA
ncbi:YrbL family protein [Agaribacterium haliotis]|uniref:YrbL family protein n=1 Tax=Agaribacterium haliotis TaxID=2013869 RepID=UPI0013042857|nr:YrbL family protein [Agaribacterium haliotis]